MFMSLYYAKVMKIHVLRFGVTQSTLICRDH